MNTQKLSKGQKTSIKAGQKSQQIKRTDILNLVYISMFAALMAVCSQIQIPAAIPFTLQTFAMFMAGGLLGAKKGTLSVIVYLAIGLAGLPVFAQFSGGPGVLFGITGGYMIGFVFTALTVGLMCDKLGRKLWVLAVSMVLGLAVCYIFGTAWYLAVVYGTEINIEKILSAISLCIVPYLPFDALKIALAAILVNRIAPLMPKALSRRASGKQTSADSDTYEEKQSP